MTAMFHTLYDIQTDTFQWFTSLLILFFFLIISIRNIKGKSWNSENEWIKPAFYILFGLMIGGNILLTTASYYKFYNLNQDYQSGQFEVIEGMVSDYERDSWSESFHVNGKRFNYSKYQDNQGYNQISREGGLIRGGMIVRISYIGNSIVKLEQAKN